MKSVFILFLIVLAVRLSGQNVAINNDGSQPNTSAMLDIKNANKGLLIPRVNLLSETDVATIPSPVTSLLVFNNNGTLPDGVGFYFWNGNNKWSKLATVNASNNTSWGLSGNSAINPTTDFIGTTDNQPLIFKTNNILSGKIAQGINSVFFGQHAGESITTTTNNTFIGDAAGSNNTSGSNNLFAGYLSGNANTNGHNNVFLGKEAGKSNTTGDDNIFIGDGAGSNNTVGSGNLFAGSLSGNANTSGFDNIFLGIEAGKSNTTGDYNVFLGEEAGNYNTTGFSNIAIGSQALYRNTTGDRNFAAGYGALNSNTTGSYNIANGFYALWKNTTGFNNISEGYVAMLSNTTGNNNVAIGDSALFENISGTYNVAIGNAAGAINNNLSNTACIGTGAGVRISNAIAFGNTNVQKWLFGVNTILGTRALQVGSTATNGNGAYLTQGGTWTNASSRNKKENFSKLNSDDLLQKIQQLSIQKWKYKGTDEYHIGPVAEDFYKAFGLGTDDKGISTVDPAGIALAAIKELSNQNEEMKHSIKKQNEVITQLQKRIETLEMK